jgi:hypothetical protein
MRAQLFLSSMTGACLLSLFVLGTARAQGLPATLDEAARRAVVESAAQALRDRYVYPDRGAHAAAAIEAALQAGGYDGIADPEAFARRLTADLEHITHDRHMYLTAPVAQARAQVVQSGPPPRPLSEGGITRAERLADDIGYIEVFAFSPLDMFTPPLDRALRALADTRALVIDVRRNIGGDPASVNQLLSYFVARAPIRVGRSVSRIQGTNRFTTQEYWINAKPALSFAGKPVLVLTGSATFSGGEAFAYHMKHLRLGTLVGETTAGAANLATGVPLAQGFEISVPYARSSGTTWEGDGVEPDVATPSAAALKVSLERLGLKEPSADIDSMSRTRVFTPRSSPAAGGEEAVRRMIQEVLRGAPNYGLLNQIMANALRERLPELRKMLAGLGAIESVTFVEIDPVFGDFYKVRFEHGSVVWSIALDPTGKVVMWQARPIAQDDPRTSR